MPDRDDSFTGYHLRGMEDALGRVEVRLFNLNVAIMRVEKKVDALASGLPASELKAVIAKINSETEKVKAASATLTDVKEQLDRTGV